jgi:hypothetical protein
MHPRRRRSYPPTSRRWSRLWLAARSRPWLNRSPDHPGRKRSDPHLASHNRGTLPTRGFGEVEKCLTPPTLLERRFYAKIQNSTQMMWGLPALIAGRSSRCSQCPWNRSNAYDCDYFLTIRSTAWFTSSRAFFLAASRFVGVQATAARMSQETVAAQDMLTRFTQWQGREPESVAADTIYGNGEVLQWLADRSITPW